MAAQAFHSGVVGIGHRALHALRAVLIDGLGEDQGATRLQEIGFAAGEQLYESFLAWLPYYTGVSQPEELDAAALSEVLSAFLAALGWGSVAVERTGAKGLILRSNDWAEADAAARLPYPSCYFSTGLLASFLTALAGGSPLAAMEIKCRSQGDPGCRFLVGSPETLEQVYDAVSAGQDYEGVLRV